MAPTLQLKQIAASKIQFSISYFFHCTCISIHIVKSIININHQPTANPSTATAVIPTNVAMSTKDSIPFSQCNDEMIQALEACERKKADEETNKKGK